MNMRDSHFLALPLTLLALACGSPSDAKLAKADAAATPEAPAPLSKTTIAPKIASDEAVFDFGAIKPTQTVEHTFTIKNVGTGDLNIDHVQKT
jgi:hypothetical protein